MCGRFAQLAQEGNKPRRLRLLGPPDTAAWRTTKKDAQLRGSLSPFQHDTTRLVDIQVEKYLFVGRTEVSGLGRRFAHTNRTADHFSISTAFSFLICPDRYLLETEIFRDRLRRSNVIVTVTFVAVLLL